MIGFRLARMFCGLGPVFLVLVGWFPVGCCGSGWSLVGVVVSVGRLVLVLGRVFAFKQIYSLRLVQFAGHRTQLPDAYGW